jgi:hypothetical protein
MKIKGLGLTLAARPRQVRVVGGFIFSFSYSTNLV